MDEGYVKFSAHMKHESDGAYLVETATSGEQWIPKSRLKEVTISGENKSNLTIYCHIPRWLHDKKFSNEPPVTD